MLHKDRSVKKIILYMEEYNKKNKINDKIYLKLVKFKKKELIMESGINIGKSLFLTSIYIKL